MQTNPAVEQNYAYLTISLSLLCQQQATNTRLTDYANIMWYTNTTTTTTTTTVPAAAAAMTVIIQKQSDGAKLQTSANPRLPDLCRVGR